MELPLVIGAVICVLIFVIGISVTTCLYLNRLLCFNAPTTQYIRTVKIIQVPKNSKLAMRARENTIREQRDAGNYIEQPDGSVHIV